LSLLTDLRDLTSKIADQHARLTYELHTLLNTVANPNIHDVEKEMRFKVEQLTEGGRYVVRLVSLNGDLTVARAAFEMAVKTYPTEPWRLTWGMQIIAKHEPKPRSGST
jgi:hypothetical protein